MKSVAAADNRQALEVTLHALARRIAALDAPERYSAAFVTVGIAWLLRTFVLTAAVDRSPFLAFGLAVLLSALAGGFGPGLLALCLSSVLAIFFYLPPELALAVHDPFDGVQLGFFAAEGLVAAVAGGLVRTAAIERVTRDRPGRARSATTPSPEMIEPLSEREKEIAQLLARGYTNEEIGTALFLSVNTVKSHLKNLYGKLGVRSRAEAVARCHDLGLIPHGGNAGDEGS